MPSTLPAGRGRASRGALRSPAVKTTLEHMRRMKLMSAADVDEVLGLFAPSFPFAECLPLADSLHVHIKVGSVVSLPRERITAVGGVPENEKDGYVKFAFASGVNVIFSSIDVAQDDLIPDLPPAARPFLDHVGIDLRRETDAVRAVFARVTQVAQRLGWGVASQGGAGRPVYCCHVEVAEKHWVYPHGADAGRTRPIEFAFGALKVNAGAMGCDLRPIDPSHPAASKVPACGAGACGPAQPGTAQAAGYYQPADLSRFPEMGAFAAPLMAKFFDYYNAVTGADGALTRREKALIALAVAHSKQCPYCIDAYTGQCLATGSTPEQMHEAVHVAAALGAGIDLIHGVQMQNVLRAKGAIAGGT